MNLKEKFENDKWWKHYFQSKRFQEIAEKARQEHKEGKCLKFKTHEELEAYLDSL